MGLLNKIFDKKKTVVAGTDKVATSDQVENKEGKSMKELYDSTKTTDNKQQKISDKKNFKYEQAYKILRKPLVTEKVTNLGAYNKYVFAVANSANKVEVNKALHCIYGIKPIKVNIIKVLGKKTKSGKISGKRKDWKKAIVTLPVGETIKIYEGV
ncbi:MAG: 50S ribosomal protein L23 [Patescibacteria group bacterium]